MCLANFHQYYIAKNPLLADTEVSNTRFESLLCTAYPITNYILCSTDENLPSTSYVTLSITRLHQMSIFSYKNIILWLKTAVLLSEVLRQSHILKEKGSQNPKF